MAKKFIPSAFKLGFYEYTPQAVIVLLLLILFIFCSCDGFDFHNGGAA